MIKRLKSVYLPLALMLGMGLQANGNFGKLDSKVNHNLQLKEIYQQLSLERRIQTCFIDNIGRPVLSNGHYFCNGQTAHFEADVSDMGNSEVYFQVYDVKSGQEIFSEENHLGISEILGKPKAKALVIEVPITPWKEFLKERGFTYYVKEPRELLLKLYRDNSLVSERNVTFDFTTEYKDGCIIKMDEEKSIVPLRSILFGK